MNNFPGRLVFFVAILARDVEPQEIGGRFSKEVGPRSELLHLIELIFNQTMYSFDVRLPALRARRNGVVTKTRPRTAAMVCAKALSAFACPVRFPARYARRYVPQILTTDPKRNNLRPSELWAGFRFLARLRN